MAELLVEVAAAVVGVEDGERLPEQLGGAVAAEAAPRRVDVDDLVLGGARSEISCGYGTSSAACSASFICVGMRNAYPPFVISASGAGSAAAGAFGAGAGVNVDRSRSRMMPTKWVTTPSEPSGTIVRSLTKSVRSARN